MTLAHLNEAFQENLDVEHYRRHNHRGRAYRRGYRRGYREAGLNDRPVVYTRPIVYRQPVVYRNYITGTSSSSSSFWDQYGNYFWIVLLIALILFIVSIMSNMRRKN